ncbi:MAG: CoA transferase [Proteobacteria bacterium]|nr:CoA transferase [Pseudomonadota bacterium]HQR03031.1 CoA transferase [Rhodocyclaceae bacterium]
MAGVLNKLRVLDLSWGIAGPMTTMMLADNGAEVIRIEPPGGDPFANQPGYKVWHRGKKSATLDLKNPADKEAFLTLARHSDILVESYAPGTTRKLGIDFDALHAVNPRLIYCSITAYGRDSKHSGRPGYDALVAARVGGHWEQRGWPEGAINHMSRRPDPFADQELDYDMVQGAPRPGPIFPSSRWPSLGACFCASTAIAAALRVREITGHGQWVETSLMQGMLAGMLGTSQRVEDPDAEMFDSWIIGARSPKGHFECADGRWVHNWVPNPRFLLKASEGDTLDANPDLRAKDDPDRFGTGREELLVMNYYQPMLAEAVKKFPAKAWVDAAYVAGMTMQEVRPTEEALNDPSLLADGCVAETRDPEVGTIRHVGLTYNLEKTPGKVGGPAPRPGQHTAEIKALAAELARQPAAPAATTTGKKLKAPLEGITVLDLGLAIAGPFGTQLLSDLGARVIKINALHDTYWHRNHIAYTANRGKDSIALNLKDPRAMKVLMQLVEKADVVQHNMRYDAAERLGIDYASLKKINPRLIYCHSRGFERKGPRSTAPGNDQTGACLSGIQWEDGGMYRGGKPLWSLTSFGDTGNGFLTAVAIAQALYHREKTGEGQFCDTSIVNAGLLNTSYTYAFPDGSGPKRQTLDGMQLGFHAGCRLYETRDGWLCITLASEEHWDKLCIALDLARLDADPRFASAEARLENDAALIEILDAALARLTAREAFTRLDSAGVPVEISDPEFTVNFHDDAECKARQLTVSYTHPYVGRMEQLGLMFNFSDTPGVIQGPPLVVGDSTRKIMRELGYSDAEISAGCAEKYIMAYGAGEVQYEFRSPWQADPVEKKA